MRRALALAEGAIGLSDPNPRVGCVLTNSDGRVIGEGFTQEAGGPHAEVVALLQANNSGADPRGGVAYVTLEPCSHFGRTPPCCDALIAAGVSKVVVGAIDPNPRVSGQGVERLRAAGIAVETGLLEDASRALNIGFFSRMQRGLPWVRMKMAASIDGRTALENGISQWITGELARTDGHAWRKRAGATLTGVGTVLQDDPRLDVRLVSTARQPIRVIVDSRLQTPLGARLLQPPGERIIYAAVGDPERIAALTDAGAEVVLAAAPNGKVDLQGMLRDLAGRGVNELHVEAGDKLNGSFVREGLVDEFLIYIAPKLIGPGRGMAAIGPLSQLQDAYGMQFHSADLVGDDLRILARPRGIAAA